MAGYQSLGELRERMFELSPAFVSKEARIEPDRLAAIESGDAPSVAELERLADLYGIDAEKLTEQPIEIAADDAVTTLALLDEFRGVSQTTRRRLLAAANAARHVVELRSVLQRRRGYDALHARHHPAPPRPDSVPYQQGAHHAHEWRRLLGLGEHLLPSVRDFLRKTFPEIAVLVTDLGSSEISGAAFADPARGPAIVLNAHGKNDNPLVRRFSVLHELGHLLMDARRGEPLATISGFLVDAKLDVEQRANAFAVRFLCPEPQLRKVARQGTPDDAMNALLERWGVHYGAAALYLRNVAGIELPEVGTDLQIADSVLPSWYERESWGIDQFPIASTPSERRTDVARLAAVAYSQGKLRRDRFARYLALTPADPVERVLDYFGLDQPEEPDD